MRAIIANNKWVYLDQVIGPMEPILIKHFSARHPKLQFIDTEQQGWDGWYRKYDQSNSRIARPLLGELVALARRHDWPLEIEDLRDPPKRQVDISKLTPGFLPGITMEDYQLNAIRAAIAHEVGLVSVPTGGGKCLGRGTPILMFDGSVKPVEEVTVGDKLMGDDSTPRVVLSVCSGVEPLYRVNQLNGDPYIVNESHVLSLKLTPVESGDYPEQIDIGVLDYLSRSKTFRRRAKGYKVAVDFPPADVPFDPYFLGLWLGDGISTDLQICVNENDFEIVQYLRDFASQLGQVVVKYPDDREASDVYAIRLYEGTHAPDWYSPFTINPLKESFRNLNLFRNKHVPDAFKFNSAEVRLSILAGFIDADGEAKIDKDTCDITHRSGRLIQDIIFLARSLGIRTSVRPKWRKCTTTGRGDFYTSVILSGNLDRIPCKLARKQFRPRRIKKDPLSYSIRLEKLPAGEYFGFEIDGNKRFLLGDFTVTHNTELMAAITKLHGCPTVILADQRVVIKQIKERLELRDVAESGVGLFYGGATPDGQTVVVGSIQSLTSPPLTLKKKSPDKWKVRAKNARAFQEIVKRAELLLVDEADKAVDKRYRQLFLRYYQGRYKYGFSGTCFDPAKPVEALILKEHLGPIIYEISRKEVERVGRIIPIRAYMVAVGEDGDKNDKMAFDIAEKELLVENHDYHEAIKKIVDAFPNDRNMVLVDTNNVEMLGRLLEEKIPGSVFVYGKTSNSKRDEALNAFRDGKLKCLIGGKILKRGLDIKGGVHNLIVCGGGKLKSDFDQKVGRAVRLNDRGYARLFFFLHLDNQYLYRHSKEQLKSVVEMGYEVTVLVDGKRVDGAQFIKSRFRIPKK